MKISYLSNVELEIKKKKGRATDSSHVNEPREH